MRDQQKTRYDGTSREAYLPCDAAGTEAMGLLITCFKRKHSFIVGDSITTGRKNQVVWSGVHHKTSTCGGSSSFGYPDETYIDRLKEELKSRGITPVDAESPVPNSGMLSNTT